MKKKRKPPPKRNRNRNRQREKAGAKLKYGQGQFLILKFPEEMNPKMIDFLTWLWQMPIKARQRDNNEDVRV